jgi:hypothetical protein
VAARQPESAHPLVKFADYRFIAASLVPPIEILEALERSRALKIRTKWMA